MIKSYYKHIQSQCPGLPDMRDNPEEFLTKFLVPTFGPGSGKKESMFYFNGGFLSEDDEDEELKLNEGKL